MVQDNASNPSRRKLLIGLSAAVGGLGAVGAATPFVSSWWPSARARAAGAPVTVDVSSLQMGQKMVVEWRGKPVWVVRRSEATLKQLRDPASYLRDPDSSASVQPEFAENPARALKPEYLILVGLCTHLGCSPLYKPEVGSSEFGKDWAGGFYCPCHGSKFDLSGRVYIGVPAPINLEVPPYFFSEDGVVTIGELEGSNGSEGETV